MRRLARVRPIGIEEYLFSLEQGLSADAYSGAEVNDVRTVLANRNKFSNEKGELRKKLFLKGPPDIWDKLEKGEISLMSGDSKDEYDYLKSTWRDMSCSIFGLSTGSVLLSRLAENRVTAQARRLSPP